MLNEHLEKDPQYCVFNTVTMESEGYDTLEQAEKRRFELYRAYVDQDDGCPDGKLYYCEYCDMLPIQQRDM